MQIESLLQQLRGRGGFEVVNNTSTDTQVRLMGRVSKTAMAGWLIIVHRLLTRANNRPGWSVDISRQYFLRDEHVVFGWRLIFQGPGLEQHLNDIVQSVISSPRPRAFVDEQPLAGAGPDRNALSATGKGAQGVLKAAVGPLAVAQAQFLAGRPS